jgi:hypothetical protein
MPLSRADAAVHRHRWAVFAALSVLFLVSIVPRARAKPFWHDEIVTLLIADLPAEQQWSSVRLGLDLAPPLGFLATAGAHAVAGRGPIASRAPAILGVWLASLAVFVFVARRSSVAAAGAAVCLLFFSSAYRYAYEARGYGLAIGFVAVAWLAWSEAAAGRRRGLWLPVLSAALAASVWTQYYAVLAFIPVLAGEVWRQLRGRRLDREMCKAIVLAAVALIPIVPVVVIGMRQSGTFWAHDLDTSLVSTYVFLLSGWADPPLPWLGLAIVVLAVVGVAIRRSSIAGRGSSGGHEVVASVAMVILPALAYAAGNATGRNFVPRYALFAVAPITAITTVLAWRLLPKRLVAIDYLAFAVLAVMFIQNTSTGWATRGVVADPLHERPLLRGHLAAGDEVVISGRLPFLQFWYYSPPAVRSQLRYLVDTDLALKYTGSDTVERGNQALARATALNVSPMTPFLDTHPQFLLYDHGSGWLVPYLTDSGAVFEEEGREAAGTVYRVRRQR